jgi:translocation and assembly module TamB
LSGESIPAPAKPDRRAGPGLWGKLIRRSVLVLTLLAAVIIAAGVGVRYGARTEAGRRVIVGLIDGLALGPAGRLHVEGMGGDVFDTFGFRKLTIIDAKGVWLEADDVALVWDPLELFAHRVHAEHLHAAVVRVMRAPVLAKEPPSPPSRLPVSLIFDDVKLRLETAPAISIERGLWDIAAKLEVHRNGRIRANLVAKSGLHAGDGVTLALRIGRRQRFLLRAEAVEAKGGALAGALGLAADRPLHIQAKGDGASTQGSAEITAVSGGATPLEGSAAWNKAGANVAVRVSLAASRLTRFFAERLGPQASIRLAAQQQKGDVYAVQGTADAANANVKLKGDIDWRRKTTSDLAIDLSARDLEKWISEPAIGGFHTVGTVKGGLNGFTYSGTANAAQIAEQGFALSRLSGRLEVSLRDREWRIRTDASGAGGGGKGLPATLLGAQPRVNADVSVLKEGRVLIRALDVTGSDLKLSAVGGQGMFGRLSFKGSASIPNVSVVRPGATGGLHATWDAGEAKDAKGWDFALDARGAGFSSGLGELDHFLGPAPHLVAKGGYAGGALDIASATLDGAALSATGKGALAANQNLSVDFDWSAKGPIDAGPIEIVGSAKGSGKITGLVSAPRADLTAELAALDLGALVVTPARLTLAVISDAEGVNGAVSIAGPTTKYGPASAKASFRFAGDGVDLQDVVADAGGVTLDGALSLRSGQPSSADLKFTAAPGAFLSTGQAHGVIKLSDRPSIGALARIAVAGSDLSAPGAPTTIHALSFSADGPLADLPFKVQADSENPVSWRFSGDGVFKKSPAGGDLTLRGGGRLRKADFKFLQPAELRFAGKEQHLLVNMAIAGGQASIDAEQNGESLTAKAALEGVGLNAFDDDFTGAISGSATLQGHGGELGGVASATLDGARSRDEPVAEGLKAAFKATLVGARLHIAGSASNAEGLTSKAAFDLPVEAAAAPFRVAIDRTKALTGTFSADGEIRPLWDLFAGGDRTFSGRIAASGAVSGTLNAPRTTGQLALADGKFRDITTGLAVSSLKVDAAFDQTEITVRRFTGVDARGGSIEGQGRVSLVENGDSTFTLNLKRFQLIDNDVVRASASGAVTVAHPAKGQGKLSGALTIDRADITATPPTPTGVVPMDVVEIHQTMKEGQAPSQPRNLGPPILLDVSIKAARGIFVKGKGLAVELSLDSHVDGTVSRPDLTGVARVVTGSYDFAGKRFDVDSAGTVRLGATPDQIRLNLSATWVDPTLTAIVRVRGTAVKPEITLTSTPVMPQDEILSRVLFGVSASQLSAAQGAELASALASLSGGGGFDVIGNLRQFAGLDRLALGGTQATGTTISGGKYVTKDIYLELTGGGRNGSAAQVEWRIRPNLSLVSRYGAALDTRYTGDTDASLSIRFRRDF